MSDFEEEIIRPQKINIIQLSLSVFETVRKVDRGDLSLEAEFQRNEKWRIEKKSKLIESIILDIPIQAIYLSEEDDNKYLIIDGQQRIRTITDFLSNKFKLMDTINELKGKRFSDLDTNIQRKIEDFQLVIFVVKKDNNPNVKFEIFERINTGAIKLNSQELRNCIYRNKGIPFIKKLSEDAVFKKLLKNKGVNINGMQDQEIILRFMSFYYKGFRCYSGNMKNFLNDTLEYYELYRDREHEFEDIFKETLKCIEEVFEDKAFIIQDRFYNQSKKQKINLALFDLIVYTFSKNNLELIASKKNIINEELRNLLSTNLDFSNSIVGSSNTTRIKTFKRFQIWENTLEKILGGN